MFSAASNQSTPVHDARDPEAVARYRVEPYVIAADIGVTGTPARPDGGGACTSWRGSWAHWEAWFRSTRKRQKLKLPKE